LDFKIINPDNKYEFCTGEFKWWRGPESANEVFHQAVRKHANGQELAIFAIILSSAKNSRSVFDKSVSGFNSEREVTSTETKRQLPAGSRERFHEFRVQVRGCNIPLILGLCDLYFRKF
jgi:hypothetical protein